MSLRIVGWGPFRRRRHDRALARAHELLRLMHLVEDAIVDATCDPNCMFYMGPNRAACASCSARLAAERLLDAGYRPNPGGQP